MSQNETALVNSCLDYLAIRKIFAYRQNTGAFKNNKGGFYRYGVVGGTDIVIVIGGQYIGVECKVGKNKQSPGQKEFQKALEKANGLYWLVYTIDELIENLKDYE